MLIHHLQLGKSQRCTWLIVLFHQNMPFALSHRDMSRQHSFDDDLLYTGNAYRSVFEHFMVGCDGVLVAYRLTDASIFVSFLGKMVDTVELIFYKRTAFSGQTSCYDIAQHCQYRVDVIIYACTDIKWGKNFK